MKCQQDCLQVHSAQPVTWEYLSMTKAAYAFQGINPHPQSLECRIRLCDIFFFLQLLQNDLDFVTVTLVVRLYYSHCAFSCVCVFCFVFFVGIYKLLLKSTFHFQDYINCAEAWIDYTCKHFSVSFQSSCKICI